MHRTRLSLIVLLATASLAAPAAHGASPDLVVSQVFARRRKRRRQLRERLRRALQSRQFDRRSHRLVDPVRDCDRHVVVADCARGNSGSGTALPRPVRVGGRRRVTPPCARCVGNDEPRHERRQGGARARHSRAHLRRLCGGLLGGHDRPRPCRVRLRHGLRGRDHGSRPLQHHRGGSRRKRMHRHRLERRRLHRRDSHSPQLVDPCGRVWERHVRRLPERAAG